MDPPLWIKWQIVYYTSSVQWQHLLRKYTIHRELVNPQQIFYNLIINCGHGSNFDVKQQTGTCDRGLTLQNDTYLFALMENL